MPHHKKPGENPKPTVPRPPPPPAPPDPPQRRSQSKRRGSNLYEFENNIVFSTGHITKKDEELLTSDAEAKRDDHVKQELLVYNYPEGFFVYCASDDDSFAEDAESALAFGYSQDLINLMRIAKENNCKFLHLDADGPLHTTLPHHEW